MVLIRHGQSIPALADQPFDLHEGHGNPPLSDRGLMQAERVAARLASESLGAIYASSLVRTQQTAQPLARQLELEVVIEPELREVFLGIGEGGRFRIMAEENHPAVDAVRASREWGDLPGAETNLELTERVVGALEIIHDNHPDEAVAVFCHGGVIGAAVGHVMSVNPFRLSGARNGSITEVVRTPNDWILRSFNDAGHIGSLFTDHDPSVVG
ncbi:MAG: histidine phosphatase family protein [Acidimicrobiales bacterium]|nr:histidine phosphatase family protein [Acidimicrobiales bacterium]